MTVVAVEVEVLLLLLLLLLYKAGEAEPETEVEDGSADVEEGLTTAEEENDSVCIALAVI